jgi:hypothetical protein
MFGCIKGNRLMLLKKSEFIKWLNSLSPNARIKTGCESNCPISTCLIDMGRYVNVSGSTGTVFRNANEQKRYNEGWINGEPPAAKTIHVAGQWADNFVYNIDELGESKGTFKVSAKECLQVLNDINS